MDFTTLFDIDQETACNVTIQTDDIDNEVIQVTKGCDIAVILKIIQYRHKNMKYSDPGYWDLSQFENGERQTVEDNITLRMKGL